MGRLVQRLSKIRMSDPDQAARALGERSPLELGRAEFRDDHVHVTARGRDGPGQRDRNAADLAALRRRGQEQ